MTVKGEQTSSEEARVDLRIFLYETVDDHDGGVAVVVDTEQQLVLTHRHTTHIQSHRQRRRHHFMLSTIINHLLTTVFQVNVRNMSWRAPDQEVDQKV